MSHTTNGRIHQVHEELGDIVDDPGMAASLPQALLHRLKAMRGILLEEMITNPEADSGSSVDSAGSSEEQFPTSVLRVIH